MKCPIHGRRLFGGPIQYWCEAGDGHRVMAADISHEVEPKEAASCESS